MIVASLETARTAPSRLVFPRPRSVASSSKAVVEVVLDGGLAAAGDDDDLGRAGGDRLFDPVLDDGLVDEGSISLGCALVAGRKRVPSPAAGKTALRTLIDNSYPAAPIGGQ